jgi:hypothetical protein
VRPARPLPRSAAGPSRGRAAGPRHDAQAAGCSRRPGTMSRRSASRGRRVRGAVLAGSERPRPARPTGRAAPPRARPRDDGRGVPAGRPAAGRGRSRPAGAPTGPRARLQRQVRHGLAGVVDRPRALVAVGPERGGGRPRPGPRRCAPTPGYRVPGRRGRQRARRCRAGRRRSATAGCSMRSGTSGQPRAGPSPAGRRAGAGVERPRCSSAPRAAGAARRRSRRSCGW